jgi:U3 small nucleolar RNA-associated protein 5
MVSKKHTAKATSNISSKASLSTSAAPKSASSSILRSAFSPSRFQLSLFASVIQGLESEQLRLHDTVSGALKHEHVVPRGSHITCLDWGFYGSAYRIGDEHPSKKRKKTNELANGVSDNATEVIAFGTSTSDIHFYSPSASRIVTTLVGGQLQGIVDFKFVNSGVDSDAWSLSGDGQLIQWNTKKASKLKFVLQNSHPQPKLTNLLDLYHPRLRRYRLSIPFPNISYVPPIDHTSFQWMIRARQLHFQNAKRRYNP